MDARAEEVANRAFLLVAQFEGFRDKAYQDQHGTWTVGYGRTGPDVGPSTVSTVEQETAWTKQRLMWLWQRIDHDAGRDLNVNQGAALVSFAYNMGLGALERSTAWDMVQAGQWQPAAVQMQRYHYVKLPSGTPVSVAGLVKRRQAEASLFLTAP